MFRTRCELFGQQYTSGIPIEPLYRNTAGSVSAGSVPLVRVDALLQFYYIWRFAGLRTVPINVRMGWAIWLNINVRSDSPFTKRSGDMVYNSWLD